MRAFRFWLASAVVFLTPTTVATWLQLYVSGYTFNADGTRDLGHLAKASGNVPIWMLLFGVPTLAIALICVGIARLTGSLTIRRLVIIAVVAGAVLGLVPSLVLLAGPSSPSTLEVAGFPLAGAVFAGLLSGMVAAIAKFPWGVADDAPSNIRERVDHAVLMVSSGLVIAAILWLTSVWDYSLAHPCCG